MPNRLAGETSPYLRQHADNPVDWWPWGEEAFAEARARDVPVLVSIGYSACHWCHVMAHESFEDPATAAVMNERFVNVKVDREQRPDVDAVYMEATQAMTGHGGWPMTVLVDHDGRPFHCGTYYPKVRRGGMPSFLELLHAVDDVWRTARDDLLAQAARLTEHLQRSSLPPAPGGGLAPDAEVLEEAVRGLLAAHDPQDGGFGRAPKFPQSMSIDVLLRSGSPSAVGAATTSLDAMVAGGMWDHLGGGFARYSVDGIWLVPHFEKMLYDQALLGRAYLHGWQVTGRPIYRQVVEELAGYVLRDLRSPGGGFASAEDADSEGEEGRFYTWTPEELLEVLGAAAADAAAFWGVHDGGNFEGRSILNRLHARGPAALERPPDIEAARQRLLEARSRRVRPGLDDKVLTEWNALMIATLAEAGPALGRADWVDAAVAAGDFLLASLRRDDGRWLRSWQADSGASVLAFAADHGALVDAFTRLYEATGEARWVGAAREAADALLELFWDDAEGGVFTTGRDGEQLIARQKDLLDNATPSANSLAAVGLLRLGALTGSERYLDAATRIVHLLGGVAGEHPTALAHLLAAVDLTVHGVEEVVLTGDRPDLLAEVRSAWRPRAVLAWGERVDSPLWRERPDDGRAYVCRGSVCDAPVATVEQLRDALSTA